MENVYYGVLKMKKWNVLLCFFFKGIVYYNVIEYKFIFCVLWKSGLLVLVKLLMMYELDCSLVYSNFDMFKFFL